MPVNVTLPLSFSKLFPAFLENFIGTSTFALYTVHRHACEDSCRRSFLSSLFSVRGLIAFFRSYRKTLAAVRRLQQCARIWGHKLHVQRQNAAAIRIQSAVRQLLAKNRVVKMRAGARVLQTWWASRLSFIREERRRKAATDLQRLFRGHRDRALVSRMQSAAGCLQTLARGFLARLRFSFVVPSHPFIMSLLIFFLRANASQCRPAAVDIPFSSGIQVVCAYFPGHVAYPEPSPTLDGCPPSTTASFGCLCAAEIHSWILGSCSC